MANLNLTRRNDFFELEVITVTYANEVSQART